MDERNLSFIINATGGELRNASPRKPVFGISTDSRKVAQGDLFVALVGERWDAHTFLDDELGKRVSACLVENDRVGNRLHGLPHIRVSNSRKALSDLGKAYREGFDLPVIALTGSNGKTSTKRFLRSILETSFRVCSSPASFNNEIGVPLSLLQLGEKMDVAIFEIGTNHPGEIDALSKIVKPNIGVLTSVGRSHLEFFGSVRSVAYEKGFLAESIPSDGCLFINGETPFLETILSRTRSRIVKIGFERSNNWVIKKWKMHSRGMTFSIQNSDLDFYEKYECRLWGRHHLTNIGLAIAIGFELGLGEAEIRKGVARCRPEPMRFDPKTISGVTILDDTYNANVDSTIAALEALDHFPANRRIAVLGEMGELGEMSMSAHHKVGERAAEKGIEHIITIGKEAEAVAISARENGARSVLAISDVSEAEKHLKGWLRKGDAVLVKASRSATLDRLTKGLIEFLESFEKEKTQTSKVSQTSKVPKKETSQTSENSESSKRRSDDHDELYDHDGLYDLQKADSHKLDLSSKHISLACHFAEDAFWKMPLEIA